MLNSQQLTNPHVEVSSRVGVPHGLDGGYHVSGQGHAAVSWNNISYMYCVLYIIYVLYVIHYILYISVL